MSDGRRELIERPSFLLSQLGFHSAAQFAERLQPLGLHPRHFGMLTYLATAGGLTQQQLAESLNIHRNAMVGLVDDLEHQGLAERRRHPADRRAYAVHLTANGRKALGKAGRIADDNDAELLALLNTQDRKTLVELLQRVAEHAGLQRGVHPRLQSKEQVCD